MGNFLVWVVWVFAAFACLGSGIAVVSFSNPFYSALSLIGNLGSLAVLFLLLSAEFVAAAQVLIYAGSVMVMFLFVIAYLGGRVDTPWAGGPSWQAVAAVTAASALLAEIVLAIGLEAGGRPAGPAASRPGRRPLDDTPRMNAPRPASPFTLAGRAGWVVRPESAARDRRL